MDRSHYHVGHSPPAILMMPGSTVSRLGVHRLIHLSAPQDRGIKMRRYGDLGIPHYWIVDPDAETIECWGLEGGVYRRVAEASVPGVLRHPNWPDLSIDLAALWR